ncbi:PREDICTED: prominin-1-A isoform X1 [Polistes dominula]|uniref:Prominin-1-A isoform X1 n=2 Tax=Polistes dominula TaxID=743375 RepID=A0ABM1I0I4_POLDO|nr:PREDICTED: prominin-1-A isoform X1 [Polistes dominula]
MFFFYVSLGSNDQNVRTETPARRQTSERKMALIHGGIILVVIAILSNVHAQTDDDDDTTMIIEINNIDDNCTTISSNIALNIASENQREQLDASIDIYIEDNNMKNNSNVSHFWTPSIGKDWEEQAPKLNFPKTISDGGFKMATLHLEEAPFLFNFLRSVLYLVHPYDVPIGLLIEAIENRITTSKLISESMHVEAIFLTTIGVCCIMACIVPGTELWLACRPIREDYKPCRYPEVLAFLLTAFVFLLGSCMVTMMVCNEYARTGIEKLPVVVETALQDLDDYHQDTTTQLRKCLTRSLDVASEAILADLDNVEELLGKPVQGELALETGLDVALDALMDLANASQELSKRAESLLKEGERARDLGAQLNQETDVIKRDLESAIRTCSAQDRPLCSVIDPSGLRLTLHMEQLLRDDRIMRLRSNSKENLTDVGRQARGEYLYVPHYIARNTLDARNQIRREINVARARIFQKTRIMETSSTELSKQLKSARGITDYVIPYIIAFEQTRWFVGLGTFLCILPVWLLLLGALRCHCRSSEDKVRPTLLCTVFMSCFISIGLWGIFAVGLALSGHIEMLLCRPFHDPEYRTLEAILESRTFLGRRLSVPLKDMFEKCEKNEAAYPAFRLDRTMQLEQLTEHWMWTGMSRAKSKLKVDLKGLKILTPGLYQRLQNLLYACGPNLTEHRIMIQGPILSKDPNALSDQLDSIARQLSDRSVARDLQMIGSNMRDLTSRRVKPLMKIQDNLVYQIAVLELQLLPFQRQINQSISHLKTIQYYIDNQGDKIAQLKGKTFINRLNNYLDQWRTHVISEMDSGVSKCRPLWEILKGMRLLLCNHILGPLNGFWFATLICAIIMIISTPIAHILSLVYRRPSFSKKDTSLLSMRSGSPDTVVIDRGTWESPQSSQEGW